MKKKTIDQKLSASIHIHICYKIFEKVIFTSFFEYLDDNNLWPTFDL